MAMLVKDIMVVNPVLLRPEQSLFSARELMLIHEYETLFVVDGDKKPIGVVSVMNLVGDDRKKTVEKVMRTDFDTIRETQPVQDAANLFSRKGGGRALPVVDESGQVVGVMRVRDVVRDLAAPPAKEGQLSPEQAVIYLTMTKSSDKEKLWIERIKEHGLRPAITQVGANAEKLPIKMRESAIVAAIAYGVIREDPREKTAVSNGVRDIILQLKMLSPGLGGGFKVGIVRGEGRISVAAYGRCGHALANSPEQILMGSSII